MKKIGVLLCLLVLFGVSMNLYEVGAATLPTEDAAEIVLAEGETYAPQTRQWQGIPGVEVTDGGRIWATFFTGGEKEPNSENYVVVSYSDDGGEAWRDPFFVIRHPASDVRTYDPSLWIDPLGRLWCTWCQARNDYLDLKTWAVVIAEPDAPVAELEKEIASSSPRMLSDGVKLNKFLVLENGDWLYFTAATVPSAITVHASVNNGADWTVRSTVSGNGLNVTEPCAVQLENGEIVLMTRIEKNMGGGIGRSVSKDNGYTWSEYASDLGAPLRGPSTRFALYRLESGNLLFVNNDSDTSRTNLTAYLSTDGGATWSCSLLLDERSSVSYPDVTQDKDGFIYVIYDKGRYEEKEIRITKFTEQDMQDGFIHSEGSFVRMAVSVLGATSDITAVNTQFEREQRFTTEAKLVDIRASLPKTIEVTASDGKTYTLEGKWSVENFTEGEEGMYQFVFSAAEDMLRYKLYDAHALLTSTVIVEKSGGCSSVLGGGSVCLGAGLAAASFVIFRKKGEKL